MVGSLCFGRLDEGTNLMVNVVVLLGVTEFRMSL